MPTKDMTWSEFKKLVEEKGVKDDMTIWYIDVSYPHELEVQLPEKGNGFTVC